MVTTHEILEIKDERVGRFVFRRFAVAVGQGEIDGYISVTINPPLPQVPVVICSTEQTTRFTSHVYNLSNGFFTIVVHRMDQGDAVPQSFFVNVAALYEG